MRTRIGRQARFVRRLLRREKKAPPRPLVRAQIIAGVLLLAALAVWATSESRRTRIVDRHQFWRSRVAGYSGNVTAIIERYDRTADRAEVKFDLETVGRLEDDCIPKLAFSPFEPPRETGQPRNRKWENWEQPLKKEIRRDVRFRGIFGTIVAEYQDQSAAGNPPEKLLDIRSSTRNPGAPALTKALKSVTLAIPVRVRRSDAWFPFDEWIVALQPQARVDVPPEVDCLQRAAAGKFVDFTTMTIILGDSLRTEQNKVFRVHWPATLEKPVEVTMRRQVFIRLLPIFLFTIACAFLYYVFRYEKPREQVLKSLGTVAALWGLRSILVPRQILIFPTLLDYALFVLIAFTFILTIIKFETKEKR